jgi:hypothetical protein
MLKFDLKITTKYHKNQIKISHYVVTILTESSGRMLLLSQINQSFQARSINFADFVAIKM